jgi:hypothetical protein
MNGWNRDPGPESKRAARRRVDILIAGIRKQKQTLWSAAPLRQYLAVIAVVMNEVKGKSALALSRDMGMSHKACWVLLHKVRRTARISAATSKPSNWKENRIDRRLVCNQNGKRQSIVIIGVKA